VGNDGEFARRGDLVIRYLHADDLPLMTRWRNEPHVLRWWAMDGDPAPWTPDDIRREYEPALSSDDPTTLGLIVVDDRPVGSLQWYRWADYADAAAEMGIPGDGAAFGVDIFIGEPDMVGRGVGSAAIDLLCTTLFAQGATSVALLTAIENGPAQRAYEKAGLDKVRQALDTDIKDGRRVESWLMVRYPPSRRLPTAHPVAIVDYDPGWPQAFVEVAEELRAALTDVGARIDHIGSTSVPGLAAKAVIDVQVSVPTPPDLDRTAEKLEDGGWIPLRTIDRDHAVAGWPSDDDATRKALMRERPGLRRINVHVRVMGRPNQRYPLLVRDYLRAHPNSAHAYATLKRDLAALLPDDPGRYADVKDAACDLIYFAAEDWAQANGWAAGPPDA
jgi:GrpB-like predicted nucleotidyltransferase (UPF0157 family)/RimJ/RimL family protein N-acetyltransferase